MAIYSMASQPALLWRARVVESVSSEWGSAGRDLMCPHQLFYLILRKKKIEAENSCAVVKFGGLGIDYRF